MEKSWSSGKGKKPVIYAASFLLPLVMMILILNSIGIAYHGKLTLLTFDMWDQYMPFIMSLRYVFRDPGTILFNWNNCLGGNNMGVFAYYMASPLNLLTLRWDVKDAPDAIYVLYLIKIGLSGLTFQLFLQNKQEKADVRYSCVLFSTCYALMSYMIADGISIMWLDAVILLPLVLLGVERIVSGRKGGIFLICMFLTFFSNFYMSYMVGIFVFLYFCVRLFNDHDGNSKYCIACAVKFACNTLLAFGLAMPVVLPALLYAKYGQMGRASHNVAAAPTRLGIGELMRQFLPFQYSSFSLYGEFGVPFLFCGSVFLILIPIFFLQKRRIREKIAYCLLGMCMFSGFLIRAVDYFWHGFRYPTGFPYRYAFLFSCWMIMTGYEAWTQIRIKYGHLILIVAALYTVVELYWNDSMILAGLHEDYGYVSREEWDAVHGTYEPFVQEMREDAGFYRKKDEEDYFSRNIDSIYGIRGTGFFASEYYNRYRIFINAMGAQKNTTGLHVTMRGCTPLPDSIMGVKYLVGEKDLTGLYQEKAQAGGVKLYENPDALSLGILISEKNDLREPEFTENVFWNQSLLMEYLGVPDSEVCKPIAYVPEVRSLEDNVTEISIRFLQQSDQAVCFYLDGEVLARGASDRIAFFVDDELLTTTDQSDTRRIIFCPELSAGEEHVIRIVGEFASVNEFYLCEFDRDAYKKEITKLREKQMEFLSCKGNRIKGSIDSADGGLMFITLPYDEGYTVYVDGDKVQTQAALDTFLSFPVAGGQHAIEIVFVPEGLKTGLLAMMLSVLGIWLCYMLRGST